jgi:hypothetical protein
MSYFENSFNKSSASIMRGQQQSITPRHMRDSQMMWQREDSFDCALGTPG